MTHKFKVGDKVKVLDGKNIPNYTGGWALWMRNYIGDTSIVTELTERKGKPAYKLSDEFFIWDERGLELVESSFPITKVIFNPPATIVLWNDGTKTVVKCQPGDTYSKELGLAMCISKKYLGNKGNFNEEFKKWIPDESIEEISVEEMRKRLDEFCHEHLCLHGCELHEDCECGRGKYFTHTDPNYNSYMTNDEIRDAYNRVFGKKKED